MGTKKIPFFFYVLLLLHVCNGLSKNFNNNKYLRSYIGILKHREQYNPSPESECVCFQSNENQKPIINYIDPYSQGVERLVIFLYKLQDSSKVYVHLPSLERQRVIPNLPLDKGDEFFEGNAYISELFSTSSNTILVVNNGVQSSESKPVSSYSEEYAEPIGINTGKIIETTEVTEITPNLSNFVNVENLNGKNNNSKPISLQENSSLESPEDEQELLSFSESNESQSNSKVKNDKHAQSVDLSEWSENQQELFDEEILSNSESSQEDSSDEDTSPKHTDSNYELSTKPKEVQTSHSDDQNSDFNFSDQNLFIDANPLSDSPNSQEKVTQHLDDIPAIIDYIDYELSPPSSENKDPEIEKIVFGQDSQYPQSFYSDEENNSKDQDYIDDQSSERLDAQNSSKLENDETFIFKLPQHQELEVPLDDKSHSSESMDLSSSEYSTVTNKPNNETEKQIGIQSYSSSSSEDSNEAQDSKENWIHGNDLEKHIKIISNHKNKLNPLHVNDGKQTKISTNSWPWINYLDPFTIKYPKKYNIATFDKWFNEQIKQVKQYKPGKNGYATLDAGILKQVITNILKDNGLFIATDGELINNEGKTIKISNLKLRPILIGNPVAYKKLLRQKLHKNGKVPPNLTYLEAVLISLMHPPKVLGIVPLGKTTVPRESSSFYLMEFSRKMRNNLLKLKKKDDEKSKSCDGKCLAAGIIGLQHSAWNNYKSSRKQMTNRKHNPNRINRKQLNLHLSSSNRINLKNSRRDFPVDQLNKLKEIFDMLNSRRVNANKINKTNEVSKTKQQFHKNKKVGNGYTNVDSDDYDYRIIGGRAATSSGTPVSIKGRSGFVDIDDIYYNH